MQPPRQQQLQHRIEQGYEAGSTLDAKHKQALSEAVDEIIDALDAGQLRVAERIEGQWRTHQWLKKAILLSFRLKENSVYEAGFSRFYDKVPLKFAGYSQEDFSQAKFRVVPHAIVRRGSYIGKDVILMPSYVNIGAYVGDRTMVDTWATVGSCAQIGSDVHISGGAGIGGVLEPLQNNPTIIGDHCFIGARSEVVEGVIVEDHCVLSMGVFIGQSTRIYNRLTGEISYGRVPQGSVVVPGSLPSKDGTHHLACAVIVKQIDAKTRAKVSLNQILREIDADVPPDGSPRSPRQATSEQETA